MPCQRMAVMLARAVRSSHKFWQFKALPFSSLVGVRSGTCVARPVVAVPERPFDQEVVLMIRVTLAVAALIATLFAAARTGCRTGYGPRIGR